MNQIEQRALYNLLRMNWLNDPSLTVESWQVENYREMPLTDLFERLKNLSIHLDRTSFTIYASECESPEELKDYLIGDWHVQANTEDHIYLLLFELWRRLAPEKPSLSIFCDELDYQIDLYDRGDFSHLRELEKSLDNLIVVLNENVDQGIEPKEAFKLVTSCCANDVETFLYDFISEQIDEENESYAQELLDSFVHYFEGNKWFDFLHTRLMAHTNPKTSTKWFRQLFEDHLNEQDLDYNLEILSFMSEAGAPQLFRYLVQETIPLLKIEDNFRDLLFICLDYYHRLDQEKEEELIQTIIRERSQKPLDDPFYSQDPSVLTLMSI